MGTDMTDGSIINLKGIGELTKPLDTLVEKACNCVGILYEPTRVRRKAKAESDANEIEVRGKIVTDRLLAQAKIEDHDIAQRALARLVQEESRAQQNMENVLAGAGKYLKEDAEPDKIDNDWVTHFFGKCRSISDDEMQDLWSRILAGEANRPGSFSKRTLDFVGSISRLEAEAFTRLCSHVWDIPDKSAPIIFELDSELCRENDMTSETLAHLDSLGLIHFVEIGAWGTDNLPDTITVSYHGNALELSIPRSPGEKTGGLETGHAIFSPMGLELSHIVDAPPLEGMMQSTLKYWAAQGHESKPLGPEDNK